MNYSWILELASVRSCYSALRIQRLDGQLFGSYLTRITGGSNIRFNTHSPRLVCAKLGLFVTTQSSNPLSFTGLQTCFSPGRWWLNISQSKPNRVNSCALWARASGRIFCNELRWSTQDSRTARTSWRGVVCVYTRAAGYGSLEFWAGLFSNHCYNCPMLARCLRVGGLQMTRTQLHCEGSSVLDRIYQVTERRARTQAKQLNFLLTYQSLVQRARPALNIGDFTRIAQDQNRDPRSPG